MAGEVKGTAGMMDQAAAGMALFAKDAADEIEVDMGAAQTFKSDIDSQINVLNEMIKTLSGKDNAKVRKEKSKEASDLSKTDQYIDAVRVIKGQEPKHGHFVKRRIVQKVAESDAKAAVDVNALPAAVDKADKKPEKEKKNKKEDSAGISKSERDELEKLKLSIIELKTQLKTEGMTGGQINKDERVATMVARMNELKEKESPGSTAAPKKDDKPKKKLSAAAEASVRKLTEEIEEYRQKLVSEFGYSKKDITNDPDMAEMTAELNKLTGKK